MKETLGKQYHQVISLVNDMKIKRLQVKKNNLKLSNELLVETKIAVKEFMLILFLAIKENYICVIQKIIMK